MADAFRGEAVAQSTKRQYFSLVEEFKEFLKCFQIPEAQILPLQIQHIEAWFSHLFSSRPMRWESFCKRVAALRSFSRSQGCFQLEHLNYNAQTSKSAFGSYMHGLRRKLEKMPCKKAQAITSELFAYLLDDILNHEPYKYLALRDVIVLALGAWS